MIRCCTLLSLALLSGSVAFAGNSNQDSSSVINSAWSNWVLSASPGVEIRDAEGGALLLADHSANGHPKAMWDLSQPIAHGEISWRMRRIAGAPSFSLQLYAPGSGTKAWDLACYTQAPAGLGIHWRRGPKSEVVGSIPFGPARLSVERWTAYRLVFDTTSGRAQLYIDGREDPSLEVTDFDVEIGRIALVAGYGVGVGSEAEFADVTVKREEEVNFKSIGSWELEPIWPSEPAAPEDWVVQDRFAEFVEWWPGAEDEEGDAARLALQEALNRQALGLGNEFVDGIRMVPLLANGIRWSAPFIGAQSSHLYRSHPKRLTPWDVPSNTRLMEPVALLARFYALKQPWNPYYHDPALGKRLRVALIYWLSLQAPAGGFPEYGMLGSSELASTSFGLDAMGEVYQCLKEDPIFADLKQPWVNAMGLAVEWAAEPGGGAKAQGAGFANQYIGCILGAWNLYEITDQAHWLQVYNEMADWWIANAHKPSWYREHSGREDFTYSLVTDSMVDRLALRTKDSRWVKSLNRAAKGSELIVGFEMDREHAVVDSTSHSRTGADSLNRSSTGGGSASPFATVPQPTQRTVGHYNHAAQICDSSRAFALDALTPEQVAARQEAFFAAMPEVLTQRADKSVYSLYAAWLWDGTGDYWALPAGAQQQAVLETRPWADQNFTELETLPESDQTFVAIRRPGYYLTLHSGLRHGQQNRGLGLLWMPGYGNVLLSSNARKVPAFGWRATGADLARAQQRLELEWSDSSPEAAENVVLVSDSDALPPIRIDLGQDALGVQLDQTQQLFALPLVYRAGDRWTLGEELVVSPKDASLPSSPVRSLRLHREGEAVTHRVQVTFSEPVVLTFSTAPRALGGELWVRGLSVRPVDSTSGGPLLIKFLREVR